MDKPSSPPACDVVETRRLPSVKSIIAHSLLAVGRALNAWRWMPSDLDQRTSATRVKVFWRACAVSPLSLFSAPSSGDDSLGTLNMGPKTKARNGTSAWVWTRGHLQIPNVYRGLVAFGHLWTHGTFPLSHRFR